MSRPFEELALEVQKYIGVTEKGGDNHGPEVEKFQKAVDGKAEGEAWCLAFVQFCVKNVDAKLSTLNTLFATEHCMTLWSKTPQDARGSKPGVGHVMLWKHLKDGQPTGSGHAGVVIAVNADGTVTTVEGNTGPGGGIVREGDGVYKKTRSTSLTPATGATMQLVGFVKPWVAVENSNHLPDGPSDAEINAKLEALEKKHV